MSSLYVDTNANKIYCITFLVDQRLFISLDSISGALNGPMYKGTGFACPDKTSFKMTLYNNLLYAVFK